MEYGQPDKCRIRLTGINIYSVIFYQEGEL